jgi:hypothetical protein
VRAAEQTLQHEAQLAREAAETERREYRASLARQAAREMLETVVALSDALPILAAASISYVDIKAENVTFTPADRAAADRFLDRLRHVSLVTAPLTAPEIQARWHELEKQVTRYAKNAAPSDLSMSKTWYQEPTWTAEQLDVEKKRLQDPGFRSS